MKGPLLAQSRHAHWADECPLLGAKRTVTNRCKRNRWGDWGRRSHSRSYSCDLGYDGGWGAAHSSWQADKRLTLSRDRRGLPQLRMRRRWRAPRVRDARRWPMPRRHLGLYWRRADRRLPISGGTSEFVWRPLCARRRHRSSGSSDLSAQHQRLAGRHLLETELCWLNMRTPGPIPVWGVGGIKEGHCREKEDGTTFPPTGSLPRPDRRWWNVLRHQTRSRHARTRLWRMRSSDKWTTSLPAGDEWSLVTLTALSSSASGNVYQERQCCPSPLSWSARGRGIGSQSALELACRH